MSQIVALIPAAGYSSRMGFFKPLQGLGSALQIQKPIETFKNGGIVDIRVIVGYKKELLSPVLSRLGVTIIDNPNYDKGMFSSIKCGVRTLEDNVDGFFLLPADYPDVNAESIMKLTRSFNQGQDAVLYPCYAGKRGHPPLIPIKYKSAILNSSELDNLRKVLENNVSRYQEININDSGISRDLDICSDYSLLKGSTKLSLYPDSEECKQILQQAGINENVISHMQAVAGLALRIAEMLNSAGCYLNLGLISAASMLHDIAKGQKEHAVKGKEIIAELGYPEVADIIGSHMDIIVDPDEPLREAEILYLADKLVQETKIVCLEDRLTGSLVKHGNAQALQSIHKRLSDAEIIQHKVENIIKKPLRKLPRP